MCTGSIPHIGYDSEVRSLISVHRLRCFRFCNVLHILTIRAIPTYRVYRLYDTRVTYILIFADAVTTSKGFITCTVIYIMSNNHPNCVSNLDLKPARMYEYTEKLILG